MRSVIQRVRGASVSVDGEVVGALDGPGLVALVGVTHTDDLDVAKRMARKIYDLRIFDGDTGEVSARDAELPILVVSQFTLYGDTKKGRRPTWDAAAPRPVAEPLIDALVAELRAEGAIVSTGIFGADMQVSLVNDGPITILLEL
jgi:D-tyrosyl-tRNA(Tyr) deacylase